MQDIANVRNFLYLQGPVDHAEPDSGGSGSGILQVFEGRDPAPPDDITEAALSFPISGGTLSQWTPTGQAWV